MPLLARKHDVEAKILLGIACFALELVAQPTKSSRCTEPKQQKPPLRFL